MLKYFISISALFSSLICFGQNTAEIYRNMEKLNFLGSVLYVAAHPDDENTALISHFSNTRHAHTGYLSMTRGDGGQNLIGTELRESLGVIRTYELLEARKIDGGEQYFTSAIDFGFSKHPDETLTIWDKSKILGEVVGRIRSFQPDIIIHRFDHRSPGTTHGHHTSSALLSFEAFNLANDTNSFSEQLTNLKIWQAKRQFFNLSWWFYGSQKLFEEADKSNFLALEIGTFDPLRGISNSQIAAASRSSHKSQGFGSSPQLGNRTEFIELIQGDLPQSNDPFEGINTTWSRIKGGEKIGQMVENLINHYDFKKPNESVGQLLRIYQEIAQLEPSIWKSRKLDETKALIKACAGLTLQLNTTRAYGTQGESLEISLESVQQSEFNIHLQFAGAEEINLELVKNESLSASFSILINNRLSTPYWLTEKGSLGVFNIQDKSLIGQPKTPSITLPIQVEIEGVPLTFEAELNYRINDPIRGEVVTPFYVLPNLGVNFGQAVNLFSTDNSQEIILEVTNYGETFDGELSLDLPEGWKSETKKRVTLNGRGKNTFIAFEVNSEVNAENGIIRPIIRQAKELVNSVYTVEKIDYKHIPKQYIAKPSEARIVRLNLQIPDIKIGYIMGAGDLVKNQLEAIGMDIVNIDLTTITLNELKQFDTILVGIRAYNVLESLRFKNQLLFDFAAEGGTLIVQYNTSRGLKTENLLPYAIRLSRDRVTDEKSPIRFLEPDHPILNFPHKITQADFNGWVQERGLYFADQWDGRYTSILGMYDLRENETEGSLLVANHGKGKVIYTGLSFFRELPAGVPGAYRLLINLLALKDEKR